MNDTIIHNETFICTEAGKDPMFKNLTTIEHEGYVYGLVSRITHAFRNIFSAYAVRLGDEISGGRLVPCYTVEWEAESMRDTARDIKPDEFKEIYPLNDSYDIIRGTI